MNFRIVISTALLVLTAASSVAAPADDLLKTEQARYAATVDEEWDTLRELLHDDLMFIHASGRSDTKASFLDRVSKRILQYVEIDTGEEHARVYGDCGVVTGKVHLELKVNGNDIALDLAYTSVYANIGGKWKLVSYQSTRLPE